MVPLQKRPGFRGRATRSPTADPIAKVFDAIRSGRSSWQPTSLGFPANRCGAD
jgi:hypothetical protein